MRSRERLKRKLKACKNKGRRRALKAKLNLEKMPKQNTMPELRTKKLLDNLGLTYHQQYPLCGYNFDFAIPEKRLLIEVNGEFFHASPLKYSESDRNSMQKKNYRRDRRKLLAAINRGWKVMYIWESDINHRTGRVRKDLIENIDRDFQSRHALEELFPPYKNFYFKNPKARAKNTLTESHNNDFTEGGDSDKVAV